MALTTFKEGSQVRLTNTFKNAAGTEIDPTSVFFWWQTPAGVATTYTYGTNAELVRSSAGVYYVDLSLNEDGYWLWEFYSTGTGEAVDAGTIDVVASART